MVDQYPKLDSTRLSQLTVGNHRLAASDTEAPTSEVPASRVEEASRVRRAGAGSKACTSFDDRQLSDELGRKRSTKFD